MRTIREGDRFVLLGREFEVTGLSEDATIFLANTRSDQAKDFSNVTFAKEYAENLHWIEPTLSEAQAKRVIDIVSTHYCPASLEKMGTTWRGFVEAINAITEKA